MVNWFSNLFAKKEPAKPDWFGERLQIDNTLLQLINREFPFDTGLLTATGRSTLEEREGLNIFEEMSRDPQVVASYTLKRNAIVSERWRVTPASESAEDVEIAQFVQWAMENLLGDKAIGLRPIMSACLYGRSVCEIVYEYVVGGQYAGRYKIKKLKPKNIGAIGFSMDKFNNVTSLDISDGLGNQSSVNPQRAVVYSWNGEFDNPYGKPDLCGVYPWWWAKKTFYKYSLVYGDKYASPIPNFKVERKLSSDEEEKLKTAAKNFHISNYFMTPKGVELELLQSSGTGGAYYIQAINTLCDAQIARAILSQTLTTNENSKTGTFSQAQVHQDTLGKVLEEIRNDIEKNVVSEQLIRRLVDINYPNVSNYPKFRFEVSSPESLAATASAIETLCNTEDDFGNRVVDPKEEWIRDIMTLPKRDMKKFPLETEMPKHREKPAQGENQTGDRTQNPTKETKQSGNGK